MDTITLLSRKKGESRDITYSFGDGIFGPYLVASTEEGISHIFFVDDTETAIQDLEKREPYSNIREGSMPSHKAIQDIFLGKITDEEIILDICGTAFQIAVWQALLSIPEGTHTTYQEIATKIGNPRAVRAVGTAIGDNPIAYIIPCHRVNRSDGGIGGYRWGIERKRIINDYEARKGEL